MADDNPYEHPERIQAPPMPDAEEIERRAQQQGISVQAYRAVMGWPITDEED